MIFLKHDSTYVCIGQDMDLPRANALYNYTLLASVASPPSDLNGRFFNVCDGRTVHTIMLYMLLILCVYYH